MAFSENNCKSTFITFAAKSTEYGTKKTVQIVCKKGEEGVRMVPGQYLCSDDIEITIDASPSFFIPHPFLPDQPGIFFQSVVYRSFQDLHDRVAL